MLDAATGLSRVPKSGSELAGAGARHGAGAPLAGGWERGGSHLSVGRESPVAALEGRRWRAA